MLEKRSAAISLVVLPSAMAFTISISVVVKMFGVSSEKGKIKLQPALLASQFDAEGRASVTAYRNGRPFTLTYVNPGKLEEGSYGIVSISAGGKKFAPEDGCIIPEEAFEGDCPEIVCELG